MKTEQNIRNAVFISYRRDGGDTMAQLLHDRLCGMGYKVFYDIDSIRGGDFEEKLDQEVSACVDFIVLLSPGVFDRCTDPKDFVRREIRLALEKKKRIIPVFMRGFDFPEKLPNDIKRIKKQNGVGIENMKHLDAKLKELTDYMLSVPGKMRETPEPSPKKTDEKREKAWLKPVLIGAGVIGLAAVIAGTVWYFVPREVTDMAYPLCETDICTLSYTGRISGGKPDGQGTLNIKWENGSASSYKGNFEKGYPAGEGTYRHSNGESYTSDNWTWGTNEAVDDGEIYTGMMILETAYGVGMQRTADGNVACSEWKEGNHFGYGEEIVDGVSIRGEYVWEDFHVLDTEDIYAYEGYAVNGEPDYFGTIWYNNREDDLYSFCGLMVNGIPRYGEYAWANKSIFKGFLDKNGYPGGYGEFTYVDGSTKSGEWSYDAELDNIFQVNGVLMTAYTDKYMGMLLDGQPNGFGKCELFWDIFSDMTYLGEFRDGLPDGYGVIHFSEEEDNWYLGNVSSPYNTLNVSGPMGQGKFVYANGDRLEGEWTFVQEYYDDGSSYNGMVCNGAYNGYGSLWYDNGGVYNGEFRDGLPAGKGVYSHIYIDGEYEREEYIESDQWSYGTRKVEDGIYAGMLCGDSISGYGVFTCEEYTYEGDFRDGQPHGSGVRTEPDGTSQNGRWENGELVEEYGN